MASAPNIIWITLDSVRQDRTSLGDSGFDTTPNIANIADCDGSAVFSQCYSHGIRTATSAPSMLTGKYPSSHGVSIFNETLPEEIVTIPERLSESGYRTMGISQNPHVSTGTGLERGFDRLEWISSHTLFENVPYRTLVKYVVNFREHFGGWTLNKSYHNTSYIIQDIAKRWVKSYLTADRPLFLYAHYNEPHWPYAPPARYLDSQLNDESLTGKEAREITYQYLGKKHLEPIANELDLTDRETTAIQAMYDAELAYTDEYIGSLFTTIVDESPDDTIVVITSDHGELLGEHGLLGHLLFPDDGLTNVPLVVYGIDGIDHQTDAIVQHSDVLQTILAVASGEEVDPVQGIDLRSSSREFAVTQGGGSGEEKPLSILQDHNSSLDVSRFTKSMFSAVRTEKYKYYTSDEFEYLFRPPNETNDLSETETELLQEIAERFDDWQTDIGVGVAADGEADFTQDMLQHLEELGYIVD